MQKALGKWLMDIAKYIVTVVILSSVFNAFDSESSLLIILSSLTASVLLFIGLLLTGNRLPQFLNFFRNLFKST